MIFGNKFEVVPAISRNRWFFDGLVCGASYCSAGWWCLVWAARRSCAVVVAHVLPGDYKARRAGRCRMSLGLQR